MSNFNQSILDSLKSSYTADKNFIKPWMIKWDYQDNRAKRKINYKNNLPQDFYTFKSPQDIAEWMNWLKVPKPDFFKDNLISPLIDKSYSFDKKFIESHQIQFDFEGYKEGLARNNAQDYLLANFYPMHAPDVGKRVLDFGSGFGRQANLWNQMEDDSYMHLSIDAIPKSYCLQHLYYASFNRPYFDYVLDSNFEINEHSKGIYHLPTWRFDLIPDNYFDKILVIQVFQELNPNLVKYVVDQFKRILKTDGILYIRDHGESWRPTHSLNVNKFLSSIGFTLEYKMHAIDGKEFHGIPRIWRKTKEEVLRQEKITLKQLMIEKKNKVDALTGGMLGSVIKKIKGK